MKNLFNIFIYNFICYKLIDWAYPVVKIFPRRGEKNGVGFHEWVKPIKIICEYTLRAFLL